MARKASPTLRLTHRPGEDTAHRVSVELTGDDAGRLEFSTEFGFALSDEERGRIQWYLETYLDESPNDPTPALAHQAEAALEDVGTRLFRAVFESSEGARRLWARLEQVLPQTRVEVVKEADAAGRRVPWELLRDPATGDLLAIRAREFVRTHPGPHRPAAVPAGVRPPIRILLAICRPRRGQDVRFQSVARRLVAALGKRDDFQLDVLRPPTFDTLARRLRAAREAGEPYHVLHFDGHGAFLDLRAVFPKQGDETDEAWKARLGSLVNLDGNRFSPRLVYPRDPQPGSRGYLAFENPAAEQNLRLVDGAEMASLLAAENVPVLVLNACRSGRAADEGPTPGEADATGRETDEDQRVRAFGSFAQEVMDAGVAAVLAMEYNVYVVTAAQFVGNLYEALGRGETFGAAASSGRKDLHTNSLRAVAYDPVPLQDWMVPVVYEAAPVRLFPAPKRASAKNPPTITIRAEDATPGDRSQVNLPPPPDIGFFGRDETLLELDRAFDTQRIVLLHAYAGSGKTTTAAEFARWYALTGGVRAVLFTSFEQYRPLLRVLDTISHTFGDVQDENGVPWSAMDDARRCNVALQVLAQIPVLWIWDNVEPVAGFPAGTPSAWSADEQRELVGFLREAAQRTEARFLLTSRRDERDWLGEHLPRRIAVPPMLMPDRVLLARALVEKKGRHLTEVEDWRPLLRFTEGNPLTITVLVDQALRDGLQTRQQIQDFVARLRAGEAAFEDEVIEGRSKSLGASLSYGFEHAFTEDERKQLALLHFFQGFVDVKALRLMGNPEADRCVPAVHGLTREAGIALLNRAAEVGLLTSYGGGYYAIHPALPWYFNSLFEKYYPAAEENQAATRAFVEAMGELAGYYARQYEYGNRDVINVLTVEEDNLLHARQLARTNGWWPTIISTMQGLRTLYEHTGRQAEWERLVNEIVPDFVHPDTDGPLQEREEGWSFVTEYRVRLATEARHWPEAERLQRARVEWDKQRAASTLIMPRETLNGAQRNALTSLAASFGLLGHIEWRQGKPGCIVSIKEQYNLNFSIGYLPGAAIAAFNLGHAYMIVPGLQDLVQAESWYRKSLELRQDQDRQGQAICYSQLGQVATMRYSKTVAASGRNEEAWNHLVEAERLYQQALDLLPADSVQYLAVAHNQLGLVYTDAGNLDRALFHWREATRYFEQENNWYNAATTRYNIALNLAKVGRFTDALLYADAARRNYEKYGDRAAAEIQGTEALIAQIKQAQQQSQGG